MAVEQDLDQGLEEAKTSCAEEGIAPDHKLSLFKILQLSMLCLCIYVLGVELKQ
jgi:hypothetical protein